MISILDKNFTLKIILTLIILVSGYWLLTNITFATHPAVVRTCRVFSYYYNHTGPASCRIENPTKTGWITVINVNNEAECALAACNIKNYLCRLSKPIPPRLPWFTNYLFGR